MTKIQDQSLKITPLGGLNEYGKNMFVFEAIKDQKKQAIIVDAGILYPGLDSPGVDYVLADYKYLADTGTKIEALVLTNVHEAHSGGAHHLINKCKIKTVIGSKLALELVKLRLDTNLEINWIIFEDRTKIELGDFSILPIRFSTCSQESFGIFVEVFDARVFYTSSFKIDQSSSDGSKTDLYSLCEIGSMAMEAGRQVDLMISDSANVEKDGYSKSELDIVSALRNVITNHPSRVLINTYNANTIRIQNIFRLAEASDRKIALLNKDAREICSALKLASLLTYDQNNLISIKDLDRYPDNEILILSTVPEGAALRELEKIAYDKSLEIQIKEGDLVINSADLPPGTLRLMAQISDQFFLKKVKIISPKEALVHVENHALIEELKFMFNLIRPKNFMPALGETRHLVRHAKLAVETGFDPGSIFVLDNGDQIEIKNSNFQIKSHINVDQILFNDQQDFQVDTKIVKERESLAKEGLVTIAFAINKKNKVVSGPIFSARACTFSNNKEWRAFCLMNSQDLIRAIEAHGEENPSADIEAYQNVAREFMNHIIKTQIGKKPSVIVMASQV